MKKLKTNFLILILFLLLAIATPVVVLANDIKLSEEPVVQQVEQTDEEPVSNVDTQTLQEQNSKKILPDLKKTSFDDSFWSIARKVGIGLLVIISLIIVSKLFKGKPQKEYVEAPPIDVDPELENIMKLDPLDEALKSFIKKNL